MDRRGSRNPRMRSRMQTPTMIAMVMAPRLPARALPANRLDSFARGEAEADQDADAGGRPRGDPPARVTDRRAAPGRVEAQGGREGHPRSARGRALRRQDRARLLQRGARRLPPAGAPRAAPDDEGLARARRASSGRAPGRDGEARPGGALGPPDVHAEDDGPARAALERGHGGADPRHPPDPGARDRPARRG